jgi:hypothetical protein
MRVDSKVLSQCEAKLLHSLRKSNRIPAFKGKQGTLELVDGLDVGNLVTVWIVRDGWNSHICACIRLSKKRWTTLGFLMSIDDFDTLKEKGKMLSAEMALIGQGGEKISGIVVSPDSFLEKALSNATFTVALVGLGVLTPTQFDRLSDLVKAGNDTVEINKGAYKFNYKTFNFLSRGGEQLNCTTFAQQLFGDFVDCGILGFAHPEACRAITGPHQCLTGCGEGEDGLTLRTESCKKKAAHPVAKTALAVAVAAGLAATVYGAGRGLRRRMP